MATKCKTLMAQGVDVNKLTYKETDKFTDEFIDTMINQLPVDSLLDEVDKVLKKTTGYDSKSFMEKHDN